jgi:thermostable 8-oxoguanine DNA glycosylase
MNTAPNAMYLIVRTCTLSGLPAAQMRGVLVRVALFYFGQRSKALLRFGEFFGQSILKLRRMLAAYRDLLVHLSHGNALPSASAVLRNVGYISVYS